jgi:Zn ribbon nucleic-acid-binding protein
MRGDDGTRCASCTNVHVVGVEVRGVYDGVLYWECLSCGHRWHRWPEGHELRRRAHAHMH